MKELEPQTHPQWPEPGGRLLFLHGPEDIFRAGAVCAADPLRAGAARAADSLVQTASSWFRPEFQFLAGGGQVV